jgi:hypothetical protein
MSKKLISWLKTIDVSGTISAPTGSLMLGTEVVPDTSVIFNQMTRLISLNFKSKFHISQTAFPVVNGFTGTKTNTLQLGRDLILPGCGCAWCSKPKFSRKKVKLFSDLHFNFGRPGIHLQPGGEAVLAHNAYAFQHAWLPRDCRPMTFLGGQGWALIRGIIKSRPDCRKS